MDRPVQRRIAGAESPSRRRRPSAGGCRRRYRPIRRRQIGVDVDRVVDVAVVDEIGGADESPRQPSIDADVGSPRLREPIALVGHVELVAGRGAAGRRRLVLVGIGVERERGRVVSCRRTRQHARVADLVRDPDVRRFAGEQARAAAQLRRPVAGEVPVDADARRPVGWLGSAPVVYCTGEPS